MNRFTKILEGKSAQLVIIEGALDPGYIFNLYDKSLKKLPTDAQHHIWLPKNYKKFKLPEYLDDPLKDPNLVFIRLWSDVLAIIPEFVIDDSGFKKIQDLFYKLPRNIIDDTSKVELATTINDDVWLIPRSDFMTAKSLHDVQSYKE